MRFGVGGDSLQGQCLPHAWIALGAEAIQKDAVELAYDFWQDVLHIPNAQCE